MYKCNLKCRCEYIKNKRQKGGRVNIANIKHIEIVMLDNAIKKFQNLLKKRQKNFDENK